ncbi:SPOR domain-containing protein, partial [Mesobacillus sp.]
PATTTKKSAGGRYKVQAGAFEDEQNANELAERLRKAVFEAYIDTE